MADYSETKLDVHGGAVHEAAWRWGISREQVLDFSANINPNGPPQSVLEAVGREWASIELYPDSCEFVAALSVRLRISPESIVVGNGSAALIFAAVRAVRPARALLLEPAFGEYRRALRATGAQTDALVLRERDRFLPDFDLLSRTLQSKRYDLVIVNNPHNPSGALCFGGELVGLADLAALTETFLMIDEAFIDYAPEASIISELAGRANVVVLRSLTKFYAIPGLRVGYAVCDPGLAARLREQIESWPVSSVALSAARAAISETAFEQNSRHQNENARLQFRLALSGMGIAVFPSAANFLLIKFAGRSGADLADWLESYRVAIRRCDSFNGLGDNFVRLAVRSQSDNMRLVELIERWLSEPIARS